MNYQALGKCMVSKNAQCMSLVISSCGGTNDPKKLVDSKCVTESAAKVEDKMHVKGCKDDLATCLSGKTPLPVKKPESKKPTVPVKPKSNKMNYDTFLKCLWPKSPQCGSYVESCKYGDKPGPEVDIACVKKIAGRSEDKMQVTNCKAYVDQCLAGRRLSQISVPKTSKVRRAMNYSALNKCLGPKNVQCALLVNTSCGGF